MDDHRFLITDKEIDLTGGDKQEKATGTERSKCSLVLFVAGDTPVSRRARKNFETICRTCLIDSDETDIVDVLEDTETVINYQVAAIPALMRVDPLPRVVLYGNLEKLPNRWSSSIREKGPEMCFLSGKEGFRPQVDAEALRDALVSGEVDAVVSGNDILFLRSYEELRTLEASEDKFRTLIENSYIWQFWLNRSLELEYTTPSCRRITGYARKDLISRPEMFFEMIHPYDVDRVKFFFDEIACRRDPKKAEFRIFRSDGRQRWISMTILSIYAADGKILGVWGSGRDITSEKQMELEKTEAISHLQNSVETMEKRISERSRRLAEKDRNLRSARFMVDRQKLQLQNLANQLVNAEQNERRRIAHILHDDLQQTLAAAKLKIDSLLSDDLDEAAMESINHVFSLIDESIQVTRNLSHDLIPPVLYNGSLSAAMKYIKEQNEKKHNLEIGLDLEPADRDLPLNISLLIFQSLQELLFNVAKHAGTRHVEVSLSYPESDRIRIEVLDRGSGFDPSILSDDYEFSAGFGLFGIKYRLELMGGGMEISSRQGKGTRIILWLEISS